MNYSGDDLFHDFSYFIKTEFKYEGIKDLIISQVVKSFDSGYEKDSQITNIYVYELVEDKFEQVHMCDPEIRFFGFDKNKENLIKFLNIVDLEIDKTYKILIRLIPT